MKDVKRQKASQAHPRASVVANSTFVLRTPVLPLDTLLEWAAAPDPRRYLQECVESPFVQEALYLASPGLVDAIASTRGKKAAFEQVELSLARYLARMAGRATPFGLFAGISTGTFGRETSLQLEARAEYSRVSRLDNGYLFKIAEGLIKRDSARDACRFWSNSSLWAVGDQLRYVVCRIDRGVVNYDLVSIESTPYLIEVLRCGRTGGSRMDLANAIVAQDADVSVDEALEYVDQLIDEQVLVSGAIPAVTGGSPVSTLVKKMTAFGLESEAEVLAGAADALGRIDSRKIGNEIADYGRIVESLKPLSIPVDAGKLFQVDMVKPGRLVLEEDVGPRVLRTVEVLARLRGSTREQTLMGAFSRQFAERYEERVVPLADALDEENGIGFDSRSGPGSEGSPLLVGLPFKGVAGSSERNDWGRFEDHMFHRLTDAIRDDVKEIALDESDISRMEGPTAVSVPDAFMSQLRLRQTASGTSILHMLSSGPSGAQVLGRFCHVSSEVETLVRAHLQMEEKQRDDVVFAEIVHVSEGRLGNVICRPLLRQYEIPYLGRSGADERYQLPMDDLCLVMRRGRVTLLSRSLGKEIVPRMSNAHNYEGSSLPVYRFLCALQAACGFYWSWRTLSGATWLPRVRIGDVIVARERWRLDESHLTGMASAVRSRKVSEYVDRLWDRLRLPRFVVVAEGDNELPVNHENPLLLEAFVNLVASRKRVQLLEMFPLPGESPVRGPEGEFGNEAIVLFAKPPPADTAIETKNAARVEDAAELLRRDAHLRRVAHGASRRTFMPGSEWLYLKAYTDAAGADNVLLEAVAPCLRELVEQKTIAQWFFIRYQDPQHHLRVRVMGDPEALTEVVMPMLEQRLRPLMENGVVSRVQYDTYHREIERYGGPEGMLLCEKLFWLESDAVTSIIANVGRRERWVPALLASESLLDCLGTPHRERHRLYSNAKEYLAKEFEARTEFFAKVGEFYRRERPTIDAIVTMASGLRELGSVGQVEESLRRRSVLASPVVEQLRELESKRVLWTSVNELASPLLHMQFNRMFHASPRAQEFVCYDLLRRILEARDARRIGPQIVSCR